MRLIRVIAGYLLIGIMPLAWYVQSHRPELIRDGRRGRPEQKMDSQLAALITQASSRRWGLLVGDSSAWATDVTRRPRRIVLDLPTAMNRRLKDARHARPVYGALHAGLTVFHNYYLLNLIADAPMRPEVVILAFNLRSLTFYDKPGFHFNELAGLIGPTEWLRASQLPFQTQGLGLDGIVSSWIDMQIGLRPLRLALDGLRTRARGALGLEQASSKPASAPPVPALLRNYDAAVDPRHPLVRMWEAVGAFARRRDIKLLVYAVPVNVERMKKLGIDERIDPDGKVRYVEQAVTRYGHSWLDLHDAVPEAEFMDSMEHLSPKGLEIVAGHLAEVFASMVRNP